MSNSSRKSRSLVDLKVPLVKLVSSEFHPEKIDTKERTGREDTERLQALLKTGNLIQ